MNKQIYDAKNRDANDIMNAISLIENLQKLDDEPSEVVNELLDALRDSLSNDNIFNINKLNF